MLSRLQEKPCSTHSVSSIPSDHASQEPIEAVHFGIIGVAEAKVKLCGCGDWGHSHPMTSALSLDFPSIFSHLLTIFTFVGVPCLAHESSVFLWVNIGCAFDREEVGLLSFPTIRVPFPPPLLSLPEKEMVQQLKTSNVELSSPLDVP